MLLKRVVGMRAALALVAVCAIGSQAYANGVSSAAVAAWQQLRAGWAVQATDTKAKTPDKAADEKKAAAEKTEPAKTQAATAPPAKSPPDKNPKKKKAADKAPPKTPAKNEPSRKADEEKSSVDESEYVAMGKVATAIRESLEVGPTLVVWLLDRTPSAARLVREVTTRAQLFYDTEEVQDLSKEESQPLLTAIAAFDEKVQFLLDPPASDAEKIKSAFDALKQAQGGREMTFAAVKQVLSKYSAMRTGQRREVLIVVVTDEAGDDPAVADELLPLVRKQAIPIYVVGVAAPWGQANPFAPNPKQLDANRKDDAIPNVGPESLRSERVEIQAPENKSVETELVDSGFGPFALEKLCRASHGLFIAVRQGEGLANNPKVWPTGKELRFDEGVAPKYAPQYVSEAEYQKFVSENKARAALAEAAKLNKLTLEGAPVTRFPKDVEAKMAKQSNQAQQYAARNTPEVDQFHDILSKGEGDREKLTIPRWQAEYDLAMGRILAIKVRLDGYNSMIAALKRGKTFTDSKSTTWVLTPADAFETESTLKKMGERAKMYLERVVKDHPGTPWAKIAAQELKTPLGWTWKES